MSTLQFPEITINQESEVDTSIYAVEYQDSANLSKTRIFLVAASYLAGKFQLHALEALS